MKVRRMEAYSLPLNNGWLDSNSAKIQPMDQTSTRDEMRKGQKKELSKHYELAVSYSLKRMSIYVRTFMNYTHRNPNIISGALYLEIVNQHGRCKDAKMTTYHRVATYSVRCEAFSKPLLSPKSHILSSQSALTTDNNICKAHFTGGFEIT